MGWNNPPIPWSEFERRLSSTTRSDGTTVRGDGGDSPAWSHKRPAYTPGADVRPPDEKVPYA